MAERDRMEIGARLRELRKREGWSQERAAHEVGAASKTWNSWETGRRVPRMSSIEKIAKCFDVDPSDLLPPDRLTELERRIDALERAVFKE